MKSTILLPNRQAARPGPAQRSGSAGISQPEAAVSRQGGSISCCWYRPGVIGSTGEKLERAGFDLDYRASNAAHESPTDDVERAAGWARPRARHQVAEPAAVSRGGFC